MLGLLAHDVSTLAIPHLEAQEGVKLPSDFTLENGQTSQQAVKAMRDRFDSDVFALKNEPTSKALSRGAASSSSTRYQAGAGGPPPSTGPTSPGPHSKDRRPPLAHAVSEERSVLSPVSSTSSMATTVATFTKEEPLPPVPSPARRGPPPEIKVPTPESSRSSRSSGPATPKQPRSQSPSQLSVRSTSTSSTKDSKRRSSRAGTLTSKFGVTTWLLNSITGRSGPSQAEASQVSIARVDVGRPPVATALPTVAKASSTASGSSTEKSSKEDSPVKTTPQPIAIKATPGSNRRSTPAVRVEESKQALGRPRSYASPLSSSPGQDSNMLALTARRPMPVIEAVAAPAINPSRPLSLLSQSQSSLARRWQHIFITPTLQQNIKWKSMCTPACMPLTTEYYPSKTELEKAYQVYSYDVLVTPEVHASFMLKRTLGKTDEEEDWPLLVMRQMAALRLALGFQFIVAPASLGLPKTGAATTGLETAVSTRFPGGGPGGRYAPPVHPIGASEFFKSSSDHAYLSMSNQIHRISFDPIEQVIQVARYVRRTPYSMESIGYGALVWPRLGDGYREVSATFAYPNLDMYGWNRFVIFGPRLHTGLTDRLQDGHACRRL